MQVVRSLTQATHPNYQNYLGHAVVGLTLGALAADIALSLVAKNVFKELFVVCTLVIAYPITMINIRNAAHKFRSLSPADSDRLTFRFLDSIKLIFFMFLAARYSTKVCEIGLSSMLSLKEIQQLLPQIQISSITGTGYILGKDINYNEGLIAIDRHRFALAAAAFDVDEVD